MTLTQAPKALQVAVDHTLGVPSTPTSWSQHQELPLPSDAGGFGQSVAISGSTAVVGTQGSIGTGVGAAYIYVTDGTTWSEQAELTPSDGTTGDLFGWSVAISGPWVVVGAFGGPNYSAKGAAYVFHRSGTTWSQQAKLTASDAENGDEFGISVAISGSDAVIGAALENSDAGAAYVFVRSGETWSQKAELKGSPNGRFGYSVSISNAIVVVGAPEFPDTGSAYVFGPDGDTWVQQAELLASDGASFDYFGVSVAISRGTVVVGADDKDNFTGSAYVFVSSEGTWTQQAELTAPDGGVDNSFGSSVAIFGSTAVIGAPEKKALSGQAYVFARSGPSWIPRGKLAASDHAVGDRFGTSVAIDGPTAFVGAPFKNNGPWAFGAAYVYVKS